jgi:chemotaxis protein MotA
MVINWLGVIIGLAAILIGNTLEGGHNSQLVQMTAGLIVFGGTCGATMLSVTMDEFSAAMRALGKVFFSNPNSDGKMILTQILELAAKARKEGLLSLESSLDSIKDPFMKGNLRHIVDGYDPGVLKELMEDQITHHEEKQLAIAKVYETAGGYSPTVGIIGAVLGLIHVMSNLSDSSKLGSGIAVAFVATVYGVGAANMILLPIANKLKKYAKAETQAMELVFTGLCGIQDGLNPRVIEDKMRNRLGEHGHDESADAGAKKAA